MEVCVDSIVSAIHAAEGGAQRLELCSALSEGGLTPSPGVLKVVKSLVTIPVFVILRPRRGLDFVYSPEEVTAMKYDIQILKENGADGFVFGVLNSEGHIDEDVCQDMLKLISPHPVTFHRAFDMCRDQFDSLEIIIRLGFQRILTSGGESTAEKGMQAIKQLVSLANNRIIIMPGAGITNDNIANILLSTGAKEFHSSAKIRHSYIDNKRYANKNCSMGSSDDGELYVTSTELVSKMANTAQRIFHDKT